MPVALFLVLLGLAAATWWLIDYLSTAAVAVLAGMLAGALYLGVPLAGALVCGAVAAGLGVVLVSRLARRPAVRLPGAPVPLPR